MTTTPDWSRIDTVLLDMDGTVLDLSFDNDFWTRRIPEAWGKTQGLDHADALEALRPHFENNFGTLRWYCLDHWSELLDLDVAALKRAARQGIRVLERAEEFLDQVRASGRGLMLVTNAHPQAVAIKLEHTGIQVHFDAVVSSHSFGKAKEEPGFWPDFALQFGLNLQRCLFVDDSERVLKGAQMAGVGQVVGILKPDSRHPPRDPFGDWPHVEALGDLAAGLD